MENQFEAKVIGMESVEGKVENKGCAENCSTCHSCNHTKNDLEEVKLRELTLEIGQQCPKECIYCSSNSSPSTNANNS